VTGKPLLAVAAAALLAGCVRAPPPDLSRDPASLLAKVRAAQERVTSCRGSARLSVSSPDLSGSLDAWVAAEGSGRLRVEIFDFFGNPAAVLVAGGGRFALLDTRAGTLHRGEDTPENLSRLLPVPLGAHALARVVCGSVPLLDGQAVAAEPGDGVVLLEIAGAGGRQVLAVGDGASIVTASHLPGARGGTPWRASFSVFRHPGGRRFPTEVELRGGGAEIGLRWRDDLEVNGAPDGALFVLDPPRGVRVIELAPGAPPPSLELPIRPATPAPR
jgi:hypothetical protein